MSHNLKTGMNIFKEMQRLKSLRDYYIQWVKKAKKREIRLKKSDKQGVS
jgi:hypothetical protein